MVMFEWSDEQEEGREEFLDRMRKTALRRGFLDIVLASLLSDAGMRISEAAQLRWRDVPDTEADVCLIYIEGPYGAVSTNTLTAMKQLRRDSGIVTDADALVFGLSVSQMSRRVYSWAKITRDTLGACA